MTWEGIIKEADVKYRISPGDCWQEKRRKRELKALYIERLKVKYGLVESKQKVN